MTGEAAATTAASPVSREAQAALVAAVVESITGDPARFDMGYWRSDVFHDAAIPRATGYGECGTKLCLAGWAVTRSPHAEWVYDLGADLDHHRVVQNDSGGVVPGTAVYADGVIGEHVTAQGFIDGRPYGEVADVAQALLGLRREDVFYRVHLDVRDLRDVLYVEGAPA